MQKSIKRLPAEWEQQAAIQLTWPHRQTDWADIWEDAIACYKQLAKVISQRQHLLVATSDVELTKKQLKEVGAPLENISIYPSALNDTWARDHGGITIMEDGQPHILDFHFNGWGQKFDASLDNQITQNIYEGGAFGNTPITSIPYILEGGGIESDGQGTILTTSHCMLSPKRNLSADKASVKAAFQTYFGTERVLWLDDGHLLGDDTDSHIDTLARFASPDTILYTATSDSNDPHYASLKKMEEQLKSFRTTEGKPYGLSPLPLPAPCFGTNEQGQPYRLPATYANFLIMNNAVLVPTYNHEKDKEALDIIGECFAKREIVGIDCSALILQHGSLHCVTMQYPVR